MSETGAIVDTNIIVRLLRKDDPQHMAAKTLVSEAQAEGKPLVLMDVVVAETLFVLSNIYGKSRVEVADILAEILNHPGIASTRPYILLEALTYYRGSKLHFVDCYLVAVAKAAERQIATFDRDRLQMKDFG